MKKKILLAVTGGIAAYKSQELLRLLTKEGYDVTVLLTREARNFVTPLVFGALSRNPVRTELFETDEEEKISHIELAQEFDLILVSPSTANMLSKHSLGIGDDLLSTVLLAANKPIIHVPAMNEVMLENPAVKRNISLLRERGVILLPTEFGELACGSVSYGRMAPQEKIIDAVNSRLGKAPKPLFGKTVVVSAGPTREYFDPFRFLSNPSTGKMGFAITQAAVELGASVTLVSGPVALETPEGVEKRVDVISAEEMFKAMVEESQKAHLIIKAAAVSDYRFGNYSPQKVKKDSRVTPTLIKNPDILDFLGKNKRKGCLLVGFSAETRDLKANAEKKMLAKNLDFIVANNIAQGKNAFGSDTNDVLLIDLESSSNLSGSKKEVARRLLQKFSEALTDLPS